MYEQNSTMAPFLVIFFSLKVFFLIMTLVIAIVDASYTKASKKYDDEKQNPTNLQSYFLAVWLWLNRVNRPRDHYTHMQVPEEQESESTGSVSPTKTKALQPRAPQQQHGGELVGQQQQQIVQLQQLLAGQQEKMEQRLREQQQQLVNQQQQTEQRMKEQQLQTEQRMKEQQQQTEQRMKDSFREQQLQTEQRMKEQQQQMKQRMKEQQQQMADALGAQLSALLAHGRT